MSKLERFLKMAQTASQLKKLRWQEEDRQQEQEEREEALKYMTPFEYQLFQKGKLPEGMGKEKGEEGAGLFPSLETIYGEKPPRKGLFGGEGALRQPTARIQETLKRRELHPLERLEAEPKTAREWTQRQMLISGVPFGEMGAEQKFVGGRFGQLPSEYELLTEKQRAKASRIATKLKAGTIQAKAGTDRQYAMRLAEKRDTGETLTEFEQNFLDKYEGKRLTLSNLVSTYNQAANVMVGGDPDSPRAKYLSRMIAQRLGATEEQISIFGQFESLEEFKRGFETSPNYEKRVKNKSQFLNLKNLAEMWFNEPWEGE